MSQSNNILEELKELQSSLINAPLQSVYQVPVGYFEGVAEQVMARIRTLEAENGFEELFPVLDTINPVMPFTVPAGYFDTLAEKVLNRIKASEANEIDELPSVLADISKTMPNAIPAGYFDGLAESALESIKNGSETAEEELHSLSPLLGGLKKEMPYSIPEGYFEGLTKTVTAEAEKPQAKVISISRTRKRWLRYAAAAVVTGLIVTTGFMLFNKPASVDPKSESAAWVAKNLKKVSTDDIEKFADLADEGALAVVTDVKKDVKEANEVKELIKDIPQEEIQKFLDETQSSVTEENSDDIFLN